MKYVAAGGFFLLAAYGIYLAAMADDLSGRAIGVALCIVSLLTVAAALLEPIWRRRDRDRD